MKGVAGTTDRREPCSVLPRPLSNIVQRRGVRIRVEGRADRENWPAGRRRFRGQSQQLAEHLSDEALTGRELDVLRHVKNGDRNRDIAENLFVSEHTIKIHVKHILEKLGANDRTHAVTVAARRGFIHF